MQWSTEIWFSFLSALFINDNSNKLRLIKQNFSELNTWRFDPGKDFTFAKLLANKFYLIVLDTVSRTFEQGLDTLIIKD
jgi:hypothetical protein